MESKTKNTDLHSYRSFLYGFALTSAILMSACILLNIVADPYGAWQTGLLDIGYDPYASRIGRGETIERFEGQTVFVGNSRTRMGLNPMAPGIPHPPALNLGISGASWSELATITRKAMNRPNVTEILLSLDYDVFVSPSHGKGGFENSRFNPLQSNFQYHCNLLFNARCIGDSLEKAIAVAKGDPPTFSKHGFEIPVATSRHERFDPSYSRKLLQRLGNYKNTGAALRYVPERVDQLGELISECLSHQIGLTILLHPLHADYMEINWASGQDEDYKNWLVHLTQTVANASSGKVRLWDFCGWFTPSCEPILSRADGPAMKWYLEPSHYTSELGDRMLSRIYAEEPSDDSFGVLLTPSTVAASLESLEHRRAHWLRHYEQEARSVRRFLPTKIATAKTPAHH